MMLEPPLPEMRVQDGYRVPKDTLSTYLFLDYLLILTNQLSFRCLKVQAAHVNFYPNYWSKEIPTRFFNLFSLVGHSFYIGKYQDLDVYIVCHPNEECLCHTQNDDKSTAVSKTVANIIMEKVILSSLSKLRAVVLNGRNVTISDTFETLSDSNYTQFEVFDFDQNFYTEFETCWSRIRHEFFESHTPRLCFVRFGQNSQIVQEVLIY
jgi:hypothetical protein